jgi:hypothetical protein
LSTVALQPSLKLWLPESVVGLTFADIADCRNSRLFNLNRTTMEDLFSTNIAVNNQNVNYRVVFDHEKYVFLTEAEGTPFSTFSFRRQNDAWQDQELLPPDIKQQAVDALEKYLLKQH